MLLFADMDNLKQVNDRFGHKNGDYAIERALLRSCSKASTLTTSSDVSAAMSS